MSRFAAVLPLILLGALGAPPVVAQDAAPPAATTQSPMQAGWQDVITGQIEAFRTGDATAAFGFAGAGFQTNFTSADAFFTAILNSGYGPIAESRMHNFGSFRMVDETTVLQTVDLVGRDQVLHQAIYQLTLEEGGWRVLGVQLRAGAGVAA